MYLAKVTTFDQETFREKFNKLTSLPLFVKLHKKIIKF